MDRDMFSNSYDERDFSLDGFLDGLGRLVSRNVDGRCVGFGFFLGLEMVVRSLQGCAGIEEY